MDHPAILVYCSWRQATFALPYSRGNPRSATRRMPWGVFELEMPAMQTTQACHGSGLLHFAKESDHAN
ncbi:hypothetical protein, partial [Xanthomonas bromi]|uniref:hypothetical protein n=1 Tax=Xanthomonas bromi TaxID=56449 RepID=UPI001CA53746